MDMQGILCALVTPLTEREDIDREAVARLTHHVVEGGVHGLLALGSTGEQIALTRESKRTFVKEVRAHMPSDMPLMVGCGATSTRLAIQNVHDAQELGADAVIVTPPCFYPFGDDGLVRYFSEIAAEASVPVYLYNISRYVGVKIGVDAVRRLLDNPRIQGIKESDRDEAYVQQLLQATRERRPDFTVIQGSERIFLKSFDWGCKAGVTVVGNLAPEIAPRLWAAWQKGERQQAEALQQKLLAYVKVVTMLGLFPLELKQTLAEKGLCAARMTSPFPELTNEQRQAIHTALAALEQQTAHE